MFVLLCFPENLYISFWGIFNKGFSDESRINLFGTMTVCWMEMDGFWGFGILPSANAGCWRLDADAFISEHCFLYLLLLSNIRSIHQLPTRITSMENYWNECTFEGLGLRPDEVWQGLMRVEEALIGPHWASWPLSKPLQIWNLSQESYLDEKKLEVQAWLSLARPHGASSDLNRTHQSICRVTVITLQAWSRASEVSKNRQIHWIHRPSRKNGRFGVHLEGPVWSKCTGGSSWGAKRQLRRPIFSEIFHSNWIDFLRHLEVWWDLIRLAKASRQLKGSGSYRNEKKSPVRFLIASLSRRKRRSWSKRRRRNI